MLKRFREMFIETLMSETETTNAIFNKEGLPLWNEVRLDMIMKVFDQTIEDYKEKENIQTPTLEDCYAALGEYKKIYG